MRSVDRFHSPAPEELMEYVDGEGTPASRAAIETHLATCAACQATVADQQRLTGTMNAWRVPSAPDSLEAPQPRAPRAWWRPSRTIAAGLAAASLVLVAVAVQQRAQPTTPAAGAMAISLGGRSAEAPSARPPAAMPDLAGTVAGQTQSRAFANDRIAAAPEAAVRQAGPRMPAVIRTARLQIVAKDFPAARESVESIVTSAAGFIDNLTVSGDTSRARGLRGTLRVPSDRLSDVLTRLRGLGVVLEDTQGTQDVSDQIVDLDARMASARATEQRLTEVLRTRTGRLSDVLEVERELTRVRFDIERLDAEKTNVTRRVSYATIDISMTEERKESLDGPLPLATRLKLAAIDGLEVAMDSLAAVALFILRAGPLLTLWAAFLGLTWLAVRRFRGSPKPTVSE